MPITSSCHEAKNWPIRFARPNDIRLWECSIWRETTLGKITCTTLCLKKKSSKSEVSEFLSVILCGFHQLLRKTDTGWILHSWFISSSKKHDLYEFMIDHGSYTHNLYAVVKLKPEKHSGLNGIRTHDLCDTGAVLYQLSYQAIWELVTSWVHNIPVDGDEFKWIY